MNCSRSEFLMAPGQVDSEPGSSREKKPTGCPQGSSLSSGVVERPVANADVGGIRTGFVGGIPGTEVPGL